LPDQLQARRIPSANDSKICCEISASRQAIGAALPCDINTSIWRSNITICSALNLFFGLPGPFPSSSSHNAWSKKARSGHFIALAENIAGAHRG
jgi:hypothetical protein